MDNLSLAMNMHRVRRLLVLLLVAATPLGAEPTPRSQPPDWDQLMTDSVKALRNNHLPDAIALCEQATQLARGFATNDTRLARSQTLRAEIYLWERNNDLAEQTFRLAVSSCEKAVGPNDPALVHPLSSLANYYYFVVRRYDQVVVLFERILKIVSSAPHPNNRDVIMWSRNLGSVYETTGRFDQAEPLFNRAVALAEAHDADWLPHELLTAADFYRAWGKCEKAEPLAQRALAIREKALAQGGVDAQSDVAVALDTLGAVYLAWSKPEQAEASYQRSLNLVQSFLSPDDADLAPRLAGLAEALRLQGKIDPSESLYRRALGITEKNAGVDSPEAAALRTRLAMLHPGQASSAPPSALPVTNQVAGLK